ncbi:MAG TPA: hypothetical protein VKJ77_02925 [Caballeronia sp.]|nr:hypothetical protein [Caballeronia sp.]
MYHALIATLLAITTPATTSTPDFLRDRIVCPAHKGDYTNPTGEAVWEWTQTLPFNGDSRDDYGGKETPTLAVDPILGDFNVGADIHGHSGGGGGMRAFVDVQSRSFVFCQNVDTASIIGIYQYLRMPYTLPKATASSVHFRSGLGLGSSVDTVRHIYGPAQIKRLKNDLSMLIYDRETPVSPGNSTIYGETTMFWFRAGRVVGFYRITGV